MPTREDIVAAARRWLEAPTPWHHQASKCGVGTDCIGLVAGVGRDVGVDGIADFDGALEFKGYGREPTRAMLEAGSDRFLDRITVGEVLPGDLLLLNSPLVRHPLHFAIVSQLEPMYMIHAAASNKKVVENRVDAGWRSRVVRAYRYRGVE